MFPSSTPGVASDPATNPSGFRDRLTPDERLREIAAILARGILRLYGSGQLDHGSAEHAPLNSPSEPPKKALEVSATSRPHVTGG